MFIRATTMGRFLRPNYYGFEIANIHCNYTNTHTGICKDTTLALYLQISMLGPQATCMYTRSQ